MGIFSSIVAFVFMVLRVAAAVWAMIVTIGAAGDGNWVKAIYFLILLIWLTSPIYATTWTTTIRNRRDSVDAE